MRKVKKLPTKYVIVSFSIVKFKMRNKCFIVMEIGLETSSSFSVIGTSIKSRNAYNQNNILRNVFLAGLI